MAIPLVDRKSKTAWKNWAGAECHPRSIERPLGRSELSEMVGIAAAGVAGPDGTDPSTEATVSDQVASAILDAALTDEHDLHATTVERAIEAYHASER